MADAQGTFVWYELMTNDLEGAAAFYGRTIGWQTADAGMPGVAYTLCSVGETRVAGLMTLPDHMRAAGVPPHWVGYVGVDDVDAMAGRVTAHGGTVHRAPDDIPGVGRFAVVADPQGAVFMLFKGLGEAPAPLPPFTPGTMGWHELHADEWQAAFAFYAALFGWRRMEAIDMGAMGTYQLFGDGGPTAIGGMMTRMPQTPRAFWSYYVIVENIDAAAARVREQGGQVINGPHAVPGGSWILHGLDPQGALFAIVGPRA